MTPSEFLGDKLLITQCCSLAMRAHHASPFLVAALPRADPISVFAFPASWSAADWIEGGYGPFGDSEVDGELFPSLKSLGAGDKARINGCFLRLFQMLLGGSRFEAEIYKAAAERRRIIFAGHSLGGAIAVLATIWLLEKHSKFDNRNQVIPLCITFGCPLVGDGLFGHALMRENWSCCFLHFVMAMDIVPRILLAPLSSFKTELQSILQSIYPKSLCLGLNSFGISPLLSNFYDFVLRNALSMSNHQSCLSMGCASSLLGTLSGFIKLSPYRPFGTYVFCCTNGKLVLVNNSDVVLQMLFYCLQGASEQENADVLPRSFKDHLQYESTLKSYLNVQNFDMNALPSAKVDMEAQLFRTLKEDLEMSKEAMLHLHAAINLAKQRLKNQARIDMNYGKIQEALKFLDDYRTTCELRGFCYYDAFKLQRDAEDFNVNVKRLELAGLWDEIIEMLRRFELPDRFEGRDEWVNLGTRYRLLVEPLDIANYYRHSKNEDTGPYMLKGRPRRYKNTQRWEEHMQRVPEGSCLESCFWAMVEEISAETSGSKPFVEVKERVLELENNLLRWLTGGKLCRDVLLEGSSFVKWWMSMPKQHRLDSGIARIMNVGEEPETT